MTTKRMRSVAVALFLALTPPAVLATVENFVLLDQRGNAHELYYHRAAPAIVIMVQDNACTALAGIAADFNALQLKHAGNSVPFFMLNSSLDDQRASIAATATRLGLHAPILDDETQLIGEALGVTHAGEVLVIAPDDNWSVAYRGPLAGADAALEAVVTGQPITRPQDTLTGCELDFPRADAAHAAISYGDDIAPLLKDKCVVCHTEGGIGPWAMNSYDMVLGFSPMIREVVRTKRMPPWHADPHIGVFKNDASLTNEQTQMLVHWIEAGSPRGDGPDPLAETRTAAIEWPLGEPDLILDIPAYTVPASGVVDYQFPRVANPLDTGVWVKAATVVPGDREVVHHILAGTVDDDTTELRRDSGVFDNYLIGYAPGNESSTFPPGTGVYIPPGGEFLFQLHYTPVGRETVDRSKIGLYFHREQPETFFRQGVVIDPTIEIPPHEARYAEVAYYEFDKDAVLHDLVPHAHYRGVASKFELVRPDGSSEVILSVPNYDFNWQRTYQFVQPKSVPAGSRLVHTTWYDNSAANPGNPDPERTVPWGLQSWDEMLYGAFSYTYVGETAEAPIHDKGLSRTAQYVGFLDRNIDGKLSWQELPRQIKKRLVQGFQAVDTNGDGGLDIAEMHVITQRMAERRAEEEQAEQPEQGRANSAGGR